MKHADLLYNMALATMLKAAQGAPGSIPEPVGADPAVVQPGPYGTPGGLAPNRAAARRRGAAGVGVVSSGIPSIASNPYPNARTGQTEYVAQPVTPVAPR